MPSRRMRWGVSVLLFGADPPGCCAGELCVCVYMRAGQGGCKLMQTSVCCQAAKTIDVHLHCVPLTAEMIDRWVSMKSCPNLEGLLSHVHFCFLLMPSNPVRDNSGWFALYNILFFFRYMRQPHS